MLKQVFEGFVLHPPHALRGDDVLALGILFDQPALDKHVDEIRMLVFPILDVLENLLAVTASCTWARSSKILSADCGEKLLGNRPH